MEKGFRDCGLHDNSNKCQNFFSETSEVGLPDNINAMMEVKNSRSPPKKREFPRKYAGQTSQQATMLGMFAAVGGVDFANHAAESSPRTFVAKVTTKAIAPLIRWEECNESAAKVKKGPSGVVFSKRNDRDDESVGFCAREYRRKDCEVEHVVPRDDEKYVKSESLKSDMKNKRKFSASSEFYTTQDEDEKEAKRQKVISVKDQMFETFQPWALKTYGDQAKTKTITARKKNRILKALDGKEHSKPDSSKFRFWVKSKGFTTQRPVNFLDNLESGEKESECSETQKDHIDLFVASTVKVFGERVYRKVAVVEDFFDIIYNVHVEQGGRNGRHAGQKRTYRIITETYAFLPREAVTKFLGSCPSCRKNLRPFSPGRLDETFNESSSEYEALNYSSQNESSLDSSTPLGVIQSVRRKVEGKISPLVLNPVRQNTDSQPETFAKSYNSEVLRTPTLDYPCNVPSKIDESMIAMDKTLGYSVGNKELDFGIKASREKSFSSSEKFKIKNLLKIEGEYEGKSRLCKMSSSSNQIKSKLDSRTGQHTRTSCLPYEETAYYCDYLSNCSEPLKLADRKYIKSPTPNLDMHDFNTTLDLTIKKPANVSINIGNSWTENLTNLKFPNEHLSNPIHWDDIKTVDVLINISNSNNNLKVCHQPYQFRGSNLCRASETNQVNVFSTSSSSSYMDDDKGVKVEECAINLSKKSRNEFAERTPDATTPAQTICDPFPVDLSKVKPITSTYLRMTRSFGLSDQDALRIDDLVSKDFKYTL